jgi:hypothetical protein
VLLELFYYYFEELLAAGQREDNAINYLIKRLLIKGMRTTFMIFLKAL